MRKLSVLVTTLLFFQGQVLIAQGSFDQEFDPDVAVPEGFKTNRTSYSAIMDELQSSRSPVSDEQLAQLKNVPLEVIFSALGEYRLNYATGFENTQPGSRLVGRALTMRFLPPRPDLSEAALSLAVQGNWDRLLCAGCRGGRSVM